MSMRTYGRLLKNIAAIALLLALLSMLLPFCKFSAGGQEMTLSGLDVVKAGGRAGYTYLTEGRVADTFVLKAPITVGTVKSSLSYEDENLDHFLQKISQMMAEQKWEKSEIVDLFHQMIPDFNHKETGKYLDAKM